MSAFKLSTIQKCLSCVESPRNIPFSSNVLNKASVSRNFEAAVRLALILIPLCAEAASPTSAEIDNLFTDIDWNDEHFSPADFRRLDESSDENFYKTPRFVEHIDNYAVESLTKYHDDLIADIKNDNLAIIDLCSSWTSHISKSSKISKFVGIGMNEEELRRNKLLTQSFVQDFNKNYLVPFPDESFDVALIQLSIDYLIHPIEFLREVHRVLRFGGVVVIR